MKLKRPLSTASSQWQYAAGHVYAAAFKRGRGWIHVGLISGECGPDNFTRPSLISRLLLVKGAPIVTFRPFTATARFRRTVCSH